MNEFQWTVDALYLYCSKRRYDLMPPCSELPKTVHRRDEQERPERVVSEETRLRLSEASSKNVHKTGTLHAQESATATARKYLPEILRLREQGLTQTEIGKILGIHQVAVSRILSTVI